MVRVRFALAIFALSIAFSGCGETPTPSNPSSTTSASTESEAQRIETNLAKLDADDRSVVVAQGKCPVSGAQLGSMGVPLKIHLPDQDVWICCDGCKDQLVANPRKFVKAKSDDPKEE